MRRGYVIEQDFEYKGFQCCVILQSMGHRCGYVNVGGTSLSSESWDDIYISCHGGVTYASDTLAGHEKHPNDWWIGWDYAHFMDGNDWEAVFEKFKDDEETLKSCKVMIQIGLGRDGHVYTEQEVADECKEVVEQILKLESEEK